MPCFSGENAENNAEVPVASSSSAVEASGSNSEIPEGVDPSFLAALPDEMREEVIAEQLRYVFVVTFSVAWFKIQSIISKDHPYSSEVWL